MKELGKNIRLNESSKHYGIDYKEMYFDAKYTLEVQKKYILKLEEELKGLNNKTTHLKIV